MDFVKTIPDETMGFENPGAEFELIIPLPRRVFSNSAETL
jgi:hypothetical protein